DTVYFHVLNPQHGSVSLSADGSSATFTPDPGYTGPASFQVVADDGYSISAPATVTITVSAAALINLDFRDRTPSLNPGDRNTVTVLGDFGDQTGVVLPASYLTYQVVDPAVAGIVSGQLQALANGTTVLLVSSHGIQAATAVRVGFPTDRTQ